VAQSARRGDHPAMSSQAGDNHGHADGPGGPLHRWVLPRQLPEPVNPALLEHARKRAEDGQNKVADRITIFAGSMAFVYIHMLWFGCWIGFGVEKYPFGLLTMIVSLEAIFLSTFVLISQNRADAKRQVVADQQWATVQAEEEQNEKLLNLSEEMLGLIEDFRAYARLAQEDHEQNDELLDLSRRTLALTTDVHQATAQSEHGDRRSAERGDPNAEDQ
jgi:uncharacterized membrane protein